jgi:8-oxo-dGTP diphosphatase
LENGVRLIAVCEPNLAPDQRITLARRIVSIAQPYAARCVLAGSCLEVQRAGAAGMHSPARELQRLYARPPVDVWIASCHDDADIQRAASLGADAAIVSPVLPCGGNPGRRPIGWQALRQLIEAAPMPVYARGGLTPSHLAEAKQSGAIGIVLPAFERQGKQFFFEKKNQKTFAY